MSGYRICSPKVMFLIYMLNIRVHYETGGCASSLFSTNPRGKYSLSAFPDSCHSASAFLARLGLVVLSFVGQGGVEIPPNPNWSSASSR